jgi:2-polyprenyl-3-methyl-5-hydroxy-6-metoxy-1,4-benzoquinol methylase
MAFNQELLATWDAIAAHWDQGIGTDGDNYCKRLQEPTQRRVIDQPGPDERALELATGNGLCARWLAALGFTSVLATDGSAEMLRHAEQGHRQLLSDDLAPRIKYQQLDVTNPDAFDALLREPEVVSPVKILFDARAPSPRETGRYGE